ncbi:hypothetical protein B0A54_15392 [Friedmanniomyces endolithicus]|uniref:RING-type domain-containing protein n=1 Tax=Friedmanniomyces endolithicus TaxID=329885 RepID=A0A4U0U5B7_9PEZI|nr:hypothetical protein LTS09_016909 [Friedmanniomyces endolithicus]TKA30198.1 hypothetical protein B0A54_15392 [Friedmanniomyces endolithicus]
MAPRKPAAAPPIARRRTRGQLNPPQEPAPTDTKSRIAKSKKVPKPKPQKYDCMTCDRTLAASSFPNQLATDECKHLINTCKQCAKAWIAALLDSTTYDKLSCPECPEIMTNAGVKAMAAKDVYARYDEMERRGIAEKISGWRWCLGDLSDQSAYAVMRGCILGCAGVEPAADVTGPALASSSASASSAQGTGTGTGAGAGTGFGGVVGGGVGTATRTADEALVTLSPGVVLTALELTTTFSGTVATEAVLGSVTLTLGGAAATVSGKAVSLASSGVEVGGSTTVAFSSAVLTFATTTSSSAAVQAGLASATGAASAATSKAGAARGREVTVAGAVGVAGLAVMLM